MHKLLNNHVITTTLLSFADPSPKSRLINNLFQLMTGTAFGFTCLGGSLFGDTKVFVYILVYFYRFLNASAIIKIRNHLARFTSNAGECERRGWRNEIIRVYLLFFPEQSVPYTSQFLGVFNALIINSRPNSGTLISGKIACSMKLNFRYRINAQAACRLPARKRASERNTN